MSISSWNEKKEKEKHDRTYSNQKTLSSLILKEEAYQKFDYLDPRLNPYLYSINELGNLNGKTILDVGCGTGWLSAILAKRGAIVYGIDISEVAIRICKQRAVANNVENKCHFEEMSFYDLKIKENFFDKIIGLSVLHHSQDKKLFCKSLSKVLKSKGKIVLMEPFGNSIWLEKLRLIIPIKVNDEDKSHWDEQIKYSDLNILREFFEVRIKEFHLFSRLDRVLKAQTLIWNLNMIDDFLLKRSVTLRKFSRSIVITLIKT